MTCENPARCQYRIAAPCNQKLEFEKDGYLCPTVVLLHLLLGLVFLFIDDRLGKPQCNVLRAQVKLAVIRYVMDALSRVGPCHRRMFSAFYLPQAVSFCARRLLASYY